MYGIEEDYKEDSLEDFKKTIEESQTDPIVDKVLTKFSTRSKLGITKYGTTLQDNNASLFEWLNHLQEELMDATLYIEKLKQNIK
jgi:succinyl-CoA synthetase beta subunit